MRRSATAETSLVTDLVTDLVLAPDHSPPNWKPTTVPPLQTIQIAGGNQALQRLQVITVTKGGRTSDVPVPSVLGSLILKAAAYQVDSRERERHAADAAFLVSLISDPPDLASQLKGSDRKRLRVLNKAIGPRSHPIWASLGADAGDAYASWQLLTQGSSSTA